MVYRMQKADQWTGLVRALKPESKETITLSTYLTAALKWSEDFQFRV